jgi:hypothetical protein
MHWIAPPGKDSATDTLEKRLWASADQFRANSGLKAQESSGPILDPACGSGGMFVSSARFVAEHKQNPNAELSIHGVEKTDETGRLCRLNLAVHGLEGDIRHGGQVNSYYDDPRDAAGRFDYGLPCIEKPSDASIT